MRIINPGAPIYELTMTEVRHRAGIGFDDDPMTADMKFTAWMGNRSYLITDQIRYQEDISKAQAEGVQILIIKEN